MSHQECKECHDRRPAAEERGPGRIYIPGSEQPCATCGDVKWCPHDVPAFTTTPGGVRWYDLRGTDTGHSVSVDLGPALRERQAVTKAKAAARINTMAAELRQRSDEAERDAPSTALARQVADFWSAARAKQADRPPLIRSHEDGAVVFRNGRGF